jgi:hypothetical protein
MKTALLLLVLTTTAHAGQMRAPSGEIVYVAPADEAHARDLGYVDVTPTEAARQVTRRESSTDWTRWAIVIGVSAIVAVGVALGIRARER